MSLLSKIIKGSELYKHAPLETIVRTIYTDYT